MLQVTRMDASAGVSKSRDTRQDWQSDRPASNNCEPIKLPSGKVMGSVTHLEVTVREALNPVQ